MFISLNRNVGTQVWRSSLNSRASNLNRFNKCQSDKKGLPGNGINLQVSDIKYKGKEGAPHIVVMGSSHLVNFQSREIIIELSVILSIR